jgi:ankyrin repeat protein
LSPTDQNSIIGSTVKQNNSFETAHAKNDNHRNENDVRRLLTKDENEILCGMTKAEADAKKKYIAASADLKNDGKLPTLVRIKECLEEGANININSGMPLRNSVRADNLEITDFLIKHGANPDLPYDKNKTAVSLVKSFDMLKLLLEHGASMNKEAFKTLSGDFEAVKYIIENYGIDPNFDDGYALRTASRTGNVELTEYLCNLKVDLGLKRGMALKQASENRQVEIVKLLIERGVSVGFKDTYRWCEIGIDENVANIKNEREKVKQIRKLLDDHKSQFTDAT